MGRYNITQHSSNHVLWSPNMYLLRREGEMKQLIKCGSTLTLPTNHPIDLYRL